MQLRNSRPWIALAALALVACSFDTATLDSLTPCTEDSACASGSCVAGRCLPEDIPSPDVDDALDLPPDGAPDSDGAVDTLPIPEDTTPRDDTDPPPPLCTSGATLCFDPSTMQVCDEAGQEWVNLACDEVEGCEEEACTCREGRCQPPLCVEGARRCEGTSLEICDGAVAWRRLVDCERAFASPCAEEDGRAFCDTEEATCDPDRLRCSPDWAGIERCVEGVGFQREEVCNVGERCEDAACVAAVCRPGALRCDGAQTLERCFDGSAWVREPCGEGLYCNPQEGPEGLPECLERRCVPGSLLCTDARSLQRCENDGVRLSLEAQCDGGETCRDGACVPPLCVAGTFRCTELGRERCTADGNSFAPLPCAGGERCVDGLCVQEVCTPGERFCDTEGRVVACDEAGTSATPIQTCDGLCEAGACQAPRCGDGIVQTTLGETCDDGNELPCDGCEGCRRLRNLRLASGTLTTEGPAFRPVRGRFSMEAWVRVQGQSGFLFGLGDPDGRNHAVAAIVEGKLYFRLHTTDDNRNDVIELTSPEPIAGTGWRHITLSRFNETGAAIYLDGALVALRPYNGNTRRIDGDNRLWVGSRGPTTPPADAWIGELHVYSDIPMGRQFVPRRSLQPRNATVALWRFNEAGGNRYDDASGQNAHLTITGAQRVADACYGFPDAARCGDGARAPWEACDEGQATATCNATCQRVDGCNQIVGPNGRCYAVSTEQLFYNDARARCEAWGGHLTTIRSDQENGFVAGLLPNTPVWIGLFTTDSSNTRRNRTWRWHSGASSSYRAWASGEPNNAGLFSAEQCVEQLGNGRWNDAGCESAPRYFVCER